MSERKQRVGGIRWTRLIPEVESRTADANREQIMNIEGTLHGFHVLEPFVLAGQELKNRVVVAPMTRISADAGGVPTTQMADYYANFARGGFGLIITEGTYTDGWHSQGYAGQPGLVTAEQVAGWERVCRAVERADGLIFAQLMHAGALSQCLTETIGPSAIQPLGTMMPEYGGEGPYRTPLAMTEADIEFVIGGFATAARRALEAGFDGVEIHGANGYLLDQFLTTYTNQRTDSYGGSVTNRVKLAAEVVRAARAAVGTGFPVGIRLSQTKVNDFAYRWPGGRADGEVIFAALREAGADFIHLASEGRSWLEMARIDPDGTTITALARQVSGLPVIVNGGMDDPERAERALSDGHGDLVSIARGAIANPDWPIRLATGRPFRAFDPDMIHPRPTLAHTADWLAAQKF